MEDDDQGFIDALPTDYLEPGETATIDLEGTPVTAGHTDAALRWGGALVHADDHYVVITAYSHAGGSHAQYREYLDPKYRDDFDAWREKYKNPFKDLKDTDRRVRNWDGELRDEQQN